MKFLAKNTKSFSSDSLKTKVYRLLDKNPLLTAKPICKILAIPYKENHNYIAWLKHKWKFLVKNERGSKCSIHGWRGWCVLPSSVDSERREQAVEVGWRRTRARNRWLLWKDRLGRMQWFETGRVGLFVRKPANLGKAYQLVCNGFSFTGLITDIKVLESVLGSVRFKGAHYVFATKQRLPRLTIDLFSKQNGVVIKVGDRSHPNSVEVVASYPDWAEKNEALFRQAVEVLDRLVPLNGNHERKESVDYVT